MKRYTIGICVYNEGEKIKRVIGKFNDYDTYDVVIVDDASSDGALAGQPQISAVTVLRNEQRRGAGYGVRRILDHAKKNGYEAVFFVSGNDKDSPGDIAKLKTAIEEGNDLVQGSRYLAGGVHGAMPAYRKIATRILHPVLFSLITGKRITDSTNGFRAVRLSMLDNPALDIHQDWLDEYELEPYLFYKAITLGYKVTEVPVTKIYPPKGEGYENEILERIG
jgi:dolichol-phosphate mannosyltransferase